MRRAFHLGKGLAGIATVATLAVAFVPAWAQDPNPNAGDAPDHGVARLSYVQGNVSMRHGDLGELSPTAVNQPLVSSDRVETGDMGRAEIQFDYQNMIRLAPSTEVRLSQLEYQQYQIQIAAGTASFRVLQDNPGQVEISTPTVSVHPAKAGTYRVTVRPDGITEITVRTGEAEIYGPQGSENLNPGQTMQVRGTPDNPEFQLVGAVPMDDFDRFNQDRDKLMQQTGSYRPGYVPPDMAGGEALDQYGQWQYDPNYGNVWVPNQPPGWAPYQTGQWIDESYYGWTWLGVEPWGWAPYHYGSWYQGPWGWAWWPGAYGPRHFWRPALVGFFGWGPGVGIGVGFGFGFGHVGWVPLAPYESFHPWYGGAVAARYGVSNVAAVNAYHNARYTNAVSSMRTTDFGHSMVSAANMARPNSSDLARASAIHGALPFAPTSASRRVSNEAVNTRGMPQTASNARFSNQGPLTSRSSGGASANTGWRNMNGYNASGVARGNVSGAGNSGTSSAIRGSSGPITSRGPSVGQASGQPSYAQPRGGNGYGNAGGRAAAPAAPNYGNSQPSQPRGNYSAPQQNRAPQQAPLRMNPPIVQQQRSAPSGGGGGSRSAPAPSRSSGGGGGGGHSGGGGHR